MPDFRTHHQQDIDLMPYGEIAKKLGLSGAGSTRQIYNRAMWKLRLRWGSRKDEIRDLYTPEPENTQPLSNIGSQWKVSELRPVELMPRREKC